MKFNNKQNECVDLPDGRKVWLSRAVAVNMTLLLLHEGRLYVAMEQRGDKAADYQGMWCLPCGYLDWNESGSDAIRRECWEELGLDIGQILATKSIGASYVSSPWHVNTDPNENRQNVSLSYGILFKSSDFPELTLGEQEGESSATEWKPVEWVFANHEFVAFNHAHKVANFIKKVEYNL